MSLLKQPVTRDTTPNSGREIIARLGTVLLVASALGAPALALLALAGRDEALLRGAWICAALALGLLLTRRFWRQPSGPVKPDSPSRGPAPAPEPAFSPTPAPEPSGALARPRVLLLDASRSGPGGNCARLLDLLAVRLAPHAELRRASLAGPDAARFPTLEPALREADAFVFATGTHWDSWSAVLQRFLEDATPAEVSSLWLGKPAAVLVTEHSVGGKAVLSRLQGVLLTLGCTLPPLSGLVVSLAVQLARRHTPEPANAAIDDFWSPDDLDVVAHNLLAAARAPRPDWRVWPVDRRNFDRAWLEGRQAQDGSR